MGFLGRTSQIDYKINFYNLKINICILAKSNEGNWENSEKKKD